MARRRLRAANSVMAGHPLNDGLTSWLLTLPHLYGGPTWWDISGQIPASITGFSPTFNWSPFVRPGGNAGIKFDGVDGSDVVWPTTNLNTTAIATSAWFSSTVAKDQEILRADATIGGTGYLILLRLTSSGTILYDIGAATSTAIATTTTYDDGLPHRVTATQSNNTMSIFIDGFLAATGSTGGVVFSEPMSLRVGSFMSGASVTFDGLIDDVRVVQGNPLASNNPAAFARLDYDQSSRGYPDALNYSRPWLPILAASAAPAFMPWLVSRSPVIGSGSY